MLTAGWHDQEGRMQESFSHLMEVIYWQEAAVLAFWTAGTDGSWDN